MSAPADMTLRMAQLHLLAMVLEADGIVTESEHAFLDRRMVAEGLSREERNEIRSGRGREQALVLLRSQSTAVREKLVDELSEAALADGKLNQHESAAVKLLAAAIGL